MMRRRLGDLEPVFVRILCVGIEPLQASAIAKALVGDAVTCSPDALASELAAASWDAVVLDGEAFAALSDPRTLRAAAIGVTWLLLGDAAEDALYAGIDSVLDSDAEVDVVAEEAWRAIRSRRDALRWPKSFIERRVVIASPWASLTDDVGRAGFQVTVAHDAGLLTALRRANHHAAVLHGGACQTTLAQLIVAIHAYDPAIGVAAVVSSPQEVAAVREAGAAAVRIAPLTPEGLVELTEQAWLGWCRAQPSVIDRVRVRTLGDVGPITEALGELGVLGGDGDGPEVVFTSLDEAAMVDGDTVGVVVSAEAETPPLGVTVLRPDADAARVAKVLGAAEREARQHRTIAALSRRLHEVDARRVELLKQLADAQLELDHVATLDSLTDTFNRRGTEDALTREIASARRTGGTLAGCLVELDVEGRIYDRFGVHRGDAIVQRVAERLKRALRLTDSIGRVGEDAFLLLLPQTRLAEAMLVADRAAAAAQEPPLDEEPLDMPLSVGVAVLPWETTGLDDALPVLRAAVERRRVNTGTSDRPSNAFAVELATSDDAGEPGDYDTEALDAMLEGLLSGDGLVAVAQPIVRVSDEVVVGYEMLARGREGLYEAPQRLLRFARHRGMLEKVDLRCLETCLAEAAQLASHLLVSINLFPSTLLDMSTNDVVSYFAQLADARLCLELSEEHFVGDPRELLDRIAALRSAGVRLAIDDVGKGRGTLDSVMLLEPDVVKIDKELITGACRDTRKERLLRRLVTLATTLGCEVVGEGVEKPDDLALLRELDVPYAQGFLWAAPAALDSIPPDDTTPPGP